MDVEIATMDNNIDGMRIQKVIALVSKHEEERHISENVPIGERNPIFFKTQRPDLEEWDAANYADVEDT